MIPQHAGAWLLTLTWLIPLLSAPALLLLPRERVAAVRRTALGVNAAVLGLALGLAAAFALAPPAPSGSTETVLLWSARIPWIPALGLHYRIGVDALSMAMVLLSAVLVFCGTLASWSVADRRFFVLLQVLAAGVSGSFITFDLLAFFLFNELTLIPTYLLIALFGSGRKEYAAMKLALLLLAGSALVLVGILGLHFESGIRSFDILELSRVPFDREFQAWAFPALFLGFAVLGNLFPFHVWSPDGHASAPTAVSMLLAGVHMKLGSYGALRIAMYLLPEGAREWMDVFLVLAAAGALWGALVAVRQRDLKYLNAYSSVSHCALVFLGLGALTAAGLRGAVLQMLAHGFITAAVFCLIGMIYARTRTRSIPAMGGLMGAMPFLSWCLVLAGFAALGLPGLAAFPAELNVFLGAFASGRPLAQACAAAAVLSIVLTAVYVLRATAAVLYGPERAGNAAFPDASPLEKVPVLLLLACILAMGLAPGPLASLLDGALAPILANLGRP